MLAVARNNGLEVSESEECYIPASIGDPDYLMYQYFGAAREDSQSGDVSYPSAKAYSICWKIREPSTNNEAKITLMLKVEKHMFFSDTLTPTINSNHLEAQIKAWLVKVFSEKK